MSRAIQQAEALRALTATRLTEAERRWMAASVYDSQAILWAAGLDMSLAHRPWPWFAAGQQRALMAQMRGMQ